MAILFLSLRLRVLGVSTEARGRPWPREREGPASEAKWEG